MVCLACTSYGCLPSHTPGIRAPVAGPAAGSDAPGAYVAVDPYEMMAELVVQLNEATCARSALHTQLLDQNAKVCLTARTSSSVVNAMVRLAAAGGPGAPAAQ